MDPYAFSAKVEKEDLRRFNLYVHFHRTLGPALLVVGILVTLAGLFTTNNLQDQIVITLVGILIIVYPIASLSIRSGLAMSRNPVFAEPLHYSFEEEGIRMSTDVDLGPDTALESKLRWENVYKVAETKTMLMIFSNQINAFLIPKSQIVEAYPTIRRILEEHIEPHRLVFKK